MPSNKRFSPLREARHVVKETIAPAESLALEETSRKILTSQLAFKSRRFHEIHRRAHQELSLIHI